MKLVSYLEFKDASLSTLSSDLTESGMTPLIKTGIHIGPIYTYEDYLAKKPKQGKILNVESALSTLMHLHPTKLLSNPPLPIQEMGSKMNTLIEHFDDIASDLKALVSELEKNPSKIYPSLRLIPEDSITLISPIPFPPSMRDGYAFRQHVESARKGRGVPMIPEFDHFPVFYFTNHMAVSGGGVLNVRKLAAERLDFELEAAVVVGKRCKNLEVTHADDAIFGYMIMNDWSARALQTEEMKLNLGPAKGKDFSTSLGPYLVTRDEMKNYLVANKDALKNGEKHTLRMRCWINGKQLSDGYLSDMNWSFAQILERASYGVALHIGDVIGSGTVGTGCLMELNLTKTTDNLWIKHGDEVALEIEGLGLLVHRVNVTE